MPPAPAVDGAALASLLEKLDALGPGDILVLAGSVPAAVPADIYPRILARGRAACARWWTRKRRFWPGRWRTARSL